MEKFKVVVSPDADGVVPDLAQDDLIRKAQEAGWTDDPRDGRAFLLPDGREILNPVPLEPPIGFTPTDSIDKLIQDRVREALRGLRGEDTIDEDIHDLEDFDIPDELPDLTTIYEFMGMEADIPRVPGGRNAKASEVSGSEPVKSEDKKDAVPAKSGSDGNVGASV